MNPWSTEAWTHDLLRHEPMIYWGMKPWSTEAWTHDLLRYEPMIYCTWTHDLLYMNPWSTEAWTHDLPRHEPMIYRGMNPWSTEAWTHDLPRHEPMIYWGMNPWSTALDEHFAKYCIKIRWKIKSFNFLEIFFFLPLSVKFNSETVRDRRNQSTHLLLDKNHCSSVNQWHQVFYKIYSQRK
jgi:hypothetical protein